MSNLTKEKSVEKKKSKKKPKQFPWFQPFLCEGGGDCVEACPTGAIEMVDLDARVPHAWVVSVEECIGCGKCANACLIGAVQMTKYVDKAIKRYKEKKK